MIFRSSGKKGLGVIGGGVGMVMFMAAAATLGWNEVRTVEQAVANAEFKDQVKNVQIDAVDPANNEKAIHFAGLLETDTGVSDDDFHFGGDGLLSLRRKVEMYQWYSYKKDNSTRYSTKWDEDYNNLSGEHANPKFPVQSQSFTVDDAHIGAFVLTRSQVESLSTKDALPPELDEQLMAQGWGSVDGELFLGKGSLSAPEVGDVRVKFETLEETELTVIGQQKPGMRVAPFIAANGYEVYAAEKGNFTIPQMIRKAEDSNTALAWVLRGAGAAGMAFGLGLAFSGWLALFAWIPVLGPLVQRMAFGAGVLIGGFLAAVLFSGAWLYAHPTVFFIGLAVIVIGAIALGMRQRKQALAGGPAMPPPPPVFGGPPPPPPPR